MGWGAEVLGLMLEGGGKEGQKGGKGLGLATRRREREGVEGNGRGFAAEEQIGWFVVERSGVVGVELWMWLMEGVGIRGE
ncbi:hypothetical protein Acr_11g0008730 [Actinidia rufa]|uniref:Uncharacterized protein n=1 Tax=Actinidia rufa TaxID=165716 RepID=A0A7J0FFA7_9ERIC|nr:hypothetical protein Acr_11g0008730 [Actinidia rufa]